jgi:serine phosphatase RsbU (regulator of sigma subunit)
MRSWLKPQKSGGPPRRALHVPRTICYPIAKLAAYPHPMLHSRLLGAAGALLVAFFFLSVPLTAQSAPAVLQIDSLGKGAAPLDGPWQFHLGDNPAWAQPATPDATGLNGWEQITTDKTWGAQGHPAYVGYAWYRRHLSLTPAPGAPPDFYLLMQHVEDVYQVYWNGRLVGHNGQMPPHPTYLFEQAPQIVHLGRASEGVLAIRVWKAPLLSFDPGDLGGFAAPPLAGPLQTVAALQASNDYAWLQSRQYYFALIALYALVMLLSLLAWFPDRSYPVLLAMAAFSGAPVLDMFLTGLHLPISHDAALGWIQPVLSLQDIGLWFLLLYLLKLDDNRRLARTTFSLAIVSLSATSLDGAMMLFDWSRPALAFWGQAADGVLTVIFTTAQFFPWVLLALGLRKRLDSARWLVAITAFLSEFLFILRIAAGQGSRFTHWTWGNRLDQPLFVLNGNAFTPHIIADTLLLLAIVYAVYRYAQESAARRQSLERELQSARELQQVLIPETLPELPGYAISSAYRPAQEVGGDFFQLIPLEDSFARSTLIVLGDVSGKGLRAAMAVSLIVGAIRSLAKFSPRPSQLLAELNQRLFARLQGGFATCVAVLLSHDGRCVVASAGHPAPFLNRRELSLPGALPLGLAPNAVFQESAHQLEAGDHLALYTDGLLEARSPSGEIFGFERLNALFARGPAAAEATEAAVRFGQEDDITVLTITRLAKGQQSTTELTIPVFAEA